MKVYELIESIETKPDLFRTLQRAAHKARSPSKNDNGRTIYPEFERTVIESHNMRFAAFGKAATFMQSKAAEKIIKDAGWFISVLKPRQEQVGLNPDKSPRIKEFLEVRLEHATEGEEPWRIPDVLYHVTKTENVPSILKKGLEPREATRPELHKYPARIFLATSLDAAKYIEAKLSKHDKHDDYTILQVKTKAVEPIYIDPEYRNGGLYTNKPIKASAITEV